MPRDQQQAGERLDLVRGDLVAVDVHGREGGQQIVSWQAATLGEQAADIGGQFLAGLEDRGLNLRRAQDRRIDRP
jgi:hypothetical protein